MVDSVGTNNDNSTSRIGNDGAQGVDGGGYAQELSHAADAAVPGDVQRQAEMTATSDGFDRVEATDSTRATDAARSSSTNPALDTAQAANPPVPTQKPPPPVPTQKPYHNLKDGSFLHNPRDLTPGQAQELERLSKDPNLHPDTKRSIDGFLDDYRNNRDSLFPNHPNPYPNPYPVIIDPAKQT